VTTSLRGAGTIHWGDVGLGAGFGLAAALGVGFIFYRLTADREMRILGYRAFSWSIVEQQHEAPHVQVLYRGTPVQRVTRTSLVLWNPGWQTVEGQDVAAADPVRIVSASGQLLRADLIYESRTSVGFKLTEREDGYRCDFALLDRHDGVVIDLLHTASGADLTIKGTIKRMPDGIRNFGPLSTLPLPVSFGRPSTVYRTFIPAVFGLGGAVTISATALADSSSVSPAVVAVIVAAWALLALPSSILAVRERRHQPPARLIDFPGDGPPSDSASTQPR